MNKTIRFIALILTVVMLFGTLMLSVGAAAVEIIFVKDKDGKNTDTIDYEKTLNQYLTLEFETPQQKLETMTMMVERDGYQLWVDDFTGEVATVKLATGEILFSNPYDVATSGKSETREEIMSQIVVTYNETSSDAKKEMNSFVEAAQRGQINVKYIKNGIRVEYSIGREDTRMLVPRLIEKERFETKIIDPLAAEINAVAEEQGKKVLNWRDYFDPKKRNQARKDSGNDLWHQYVQLLAFYQYFEKGEKRGDKHVSKVLDSMSVYYFETTATMTELNKVENIIKTYVPSYTYEDLENDHNKTQYVSSAMTPPVFKMALEYTLDNMGVKVSLPANGLRFNESLYQIENISVLPYMGAGGNYVGDNTSDKITGYNFFPDGSGAIFRHEDLAGGVSRSTTAKVYGQDYAYNTITGSHQEITRYPVFGIVSNDAYYNKISDGETAPETGENTEAGKNAKAGEDGNTTEDENVESEVKLERVERDRGFVAIIEEGDALAELSTYHAGSLSKYNTVKMFFTPRPKDSYNLANALSVGENKPWTVVSSRKYTGNYTIRYIMLTDDTVAKEKGITDYYETSWIGMAKAYRDYLYAKGELDALTKEEVKEDIPVYIQTFGALETLEKFLSIPISVMTPLTSFEDIKTMHSELSAEGVSNIKFKLTGYSNGGMYSSVPADLDWEDAVGGKDGYEELLAYAQANGFELFPDFNFAYARSTENSIFDSLVYRNHLVKSINDTYMSKRYYSATRQTYIGRFELAISPAYYATFYDELAENLLESYSDGMTSAISIGTLGTELNSDFDEDEPYNREDSKAHTISIFEKADQDFDHVMTDGANAYTWKYVDYIVNAPLDSSRYIFSSAAVPFIGVVLHGSVQFAGTPLNMEGNIGYSFLKAIENGASLNFTLCYQNYDEFKEYVDLSEYYSVRYDILKGEVSRYYNLLNILTKDIQLSKIVAHDFLIGERIPDADEMEADKVQSEKEAQELQSALEAEKKKNYYASINHGRTDAAVEIQAALEQIRNYHGSVLQYSQKLNEMLDQLKKIKNGETVTDNAGVAIDEATLIGEIKPYLTAIETLVKQLAEQYVIYDTAYIDGGLAYNHYVLGKETYTFDDPMGGFSKEFKDKVSEAYEIIKSAYTECESLAKQAYATATTAFEKAKASDVAELLPPVLVDPTAKPEVEAPEEEENDGYNYTKYTDDSDMIVRVEYDNGVFFILNFNYYDVSVVYNGVEYKIENYGGVRVNADGKTVAFSVNK